MFTITAYNNQYMYIDQNSMQVILSVGVDESLSVAPAPLTLALALDRSGSMEGERIHAARDGAIKVIQSLDETIEFLVVTFNENAQLLFGPAMGTRENKQRAITMLQTVRSSGRTRMSTALDAIVKHLGNDQTRAARILFLTDGKNEGETRSALTQSIQRCTSANISIDAWGVGTDWDAAELRSMADKTHGTADIIPTPKQVASAFAASFSAMRKTALTNVHLQLWSPAGVTLKSVQQVYPSLVPLSFQSDPTNQRQVSVSLGSFAVGEQHEYLCNLETPVYPPGQQFLLLRPSMQYVEAHMGIQEEKSGRSGWAFAQWTEDVALAAQTEQHVAHYTHQEELSQRLKDGQAALAAGDTTRATSLLGEALEISERINNERITRLLNTIVLRDAKGTIRLNQQADAVAKKTLAITTGRTTKLK